MTALCTGVILAGGASTRMGRDKATLRLGNGRLMIEVVAEALAACCTNVIVSGASSGLSGARHVPDERPGRGPLGGIEAVLASGITDTYVFCPCDMSRVRAEMIMPLVAAPADAVVVVLRLRGEDRFLSLPARISRTALLVITEMLDAGEGAVYRALERLSPHVVDVPAEWAAALRGANTVEDL